MRVCASHVSLAEGDKWHLLIGARQRITGGPRITAVRRSRPLEMPLSEPAGLRKVRGPGLGGAGASLGIKGGVRGRGISLPTHEREWSPQRVSFLSVGLICQNHLKQ